MPRRLARGAWAPAAGALVLALGAAACGGGGDNANANSANRAANGNSAAVNAGGAANTISNSVAGAANAVSNAAAGATDTALKNLVQANLTRYGVSGVTVEVSNNEVTLKGSIPRAKLQDAMKAANEPSPRKVNNQLNVQ